MSDITCSFFGHRNTKLTFNLEQKLYHILEELIVNHGVSTFLFGSRSNFDFICHKLVTNLKQKYPQIKRIAYTCKHETCILQNELPKWEKIYSYHTQQKISLLGVEKEHPYNSNLNPSKASYIKRNQEMIDNSSFCIFYYDVNYLPPKRKYYKTALTFYQPQSGTAIAYKYAKQKNKTIINIFNHLKI